MKLLISQNDHTIVLSFGEKKETTSVCGRGVKKAGQKNSKEESRLTGCKPQTLEEQLLQSYSIIHTEWVN